MKKYVQRKQSGWISGKQFVKKERIAHLVVIATFGFMYLSYSMIDKYPLAAVVVAFVSVLTAISKQLISDREANLYTEH